MAQRTQIYLTDEQWARLDEMARQKDITLAEVLRAARLGLRMPDALIGATALVHQLTLLTRNADDFRRAPGLRIRAT